MQRGQNPPKTALSCWGCPRPEEFDLMALPSTVWEQKHLRHSPCWPASTSSPHITGHSFITTMKQSLRALLLLPSFHGRQWPLNAPVPGQVDQGKHRKIHTVLRTETSPEMTRGCCSTGLHGPSAGTLPTMGWVLLAQ